MSHQAPKRRSGTQSLAGQIARRRRTQLQSATQPRGRGGWSSLLRLTPCNEDGGQHSRWPTLSRLFRSPSSAPAFLCTDFAPSQWFKP
ncbi:hypothetical protein M8A51_05550 [Schlegelella sp. S2-27]|uniref:Uncharacterized protein n=1 Tax=Caldimonas mangrovi TaxID=2944811 RepID=A0ABT0YKV5_9BURK|nr:hypothetical protein [Caldimonas mangrovi]MCM5678994.1 hypothetical protein [Caldimonas mangrovi]